MGPWADLIPSLLTAGESVIARHSKWIELKHLVDLVQDTSHPLRSVTILLTKNNDKSATSNNKIPSAPNKNPEPFINKTHGFQPSYFSLLFASLAVELGQTIYGDSNSRTPSKYKYCSSYGSTINKSLEGGGWVTYWKAITTKTSVRVALVFPALIV